MPSINQVEKTSYEAVRIDYTSKDYIAILDDLINSIPGITQKWNTTDENDPGMILVKLMSIVGDMLFFQQDMMCLEVYPSSVTLRKNAATIYKLIGYKMHWYQSATLEANIVNAYSNGATMPRFCTFTTKDGETTYTTFKQYELPSNMNNNGLETIVELVQGIPVTPTRTSSNPYPEIGKPWHSVYNFNYTASDVINNRIYLKDSDIDESHIILIDDQNEEWELQDNVYLTTAIGRFFEFGIDVNDKAYIELIDYWENFNIKKFKIFYIKSKGTEGEIFANTLTDLTGNVWSRGGDDVNPTTYNVSNFIHFTHYNSTMAKDPETPDEARKNSVKYQNTLDTLITLADFERAVLREPGVANVRATDLTNDPGIEVNFALGNIKMDTIERIDSETGDIKQADVIDEKDVEILENYLVDPTRYPISSYQRRLADVNQDGKVDLKDLKCLKEYINPTSYALGDINQDGKVDEKDLTLLEDHLNSGTSPLSDFQIQLADINQDGVVNEDDLDYLQKCLDGRLFLPDITLVDKSASGSTGIANISDVEQLEGSVVKLYILRTSEWEVVDDEVYTSMILSDLQENKILPLTLKVDLHSIQKYYWTIKGSFLTKEPLSRDELQDIMVTINNNLKHKYAVQNINFNSLIDYKGVIETILAVDNRILMVDLDPIEYIDEEGNKISKEQLTGKYTFTVPQLKNENESENLHYKFTLPNVPILPGSVMLRINMGQYNLKDNGNGTIFNVDNVLARKGTIDYVTGEVDIEFVAPVIDDIVINYTKNKTNIATYSNLSTQTFYFDSSSLLIDNLQDVVEGGA